MTDWLSRCLFYKLCYLPPVDAIVQHIDDDGQTVRVRAVVVSQHVAVGQGAVSQAEGSEVIHLQERCEVAVVVYYWMCS